MEGMTEELGGQSERGQDDICPVLPNDMLPISKDSVCAPSEPGQDDAEPPPDWLKPLEDFEEEEEEDDKGDKVKSVKKRGKRAKRNVKYVVLFMFLGIDALLLCFHCFKVHLKSRTHLYYSID